MIVGVNGLMFRSSLSVLVLVVASATATAAVVLENQLVDHPSPYLAMHAEDPVRWQAWSRATLQKARELREWIDRDGLDTRVEIDGGVNLDNLEEVAATGVDMIVAGSAVFHSGDVQGTTETMVRRLAAQAERARSC